MVQNDIIIRWTSIIRWEIRS